jgi:hypothetical protein
VNCGEVVIMPNAKDLMRLAHQQKKLQDVKINTSTTAAESKIESKPAETTVVAQTKGNISADHLSPAAKKIARMDVSPEVYGVSAWKSNFDLHNKELVEFIRNFSANNQLNGGCAITKSQLIEVILDVMYYDLGLEPIGFQNIQELRSYIQEKIKN